MKKLVSKVLKIGRQIIVVVFLLLITTIILISIPAIQTKIVGKLSRDLSEALKTEVSVEHVSISLTGKLIFDNVLVNDQQGDSLFFIHELRARFQSLNRKERRIVLSGITIDQALVNFIQPMEGGDPNFQFFADFFAVPAGSGGGVWTILFKDLALKASTFRYKVDGSTPVTDRDFDEGDFAFNQINGSLKDFYIIGDSLNFKMKNLTTVEKNGLRIKRMVCKAAIHWNGMDYSSLWLETEDSRIEDKIEFVYNGYPRLADFVDSVYLNVNLNKSTISVKDLAYFSHSLNPYIENTIRFSGEAKGYVRRFKVRDFDMALGQNTVLKGKIDLTGLPDWRSTFTDLDLSEFTSSAEDIQQIFALSELPDKLDRFENPVFSGHLTGFYSDFAADGVLVSSLGYLRSRINFKLGTDEKPKYSGNLIAENFKIGKFLDQKTLNMTSFQFDLKEGAGLNFQELKTSFVSQIDYIDFNGYRLTNVFLDGLYKNKSFDGTAKLDDKNAKFTFNGKMDFNSQLPTYKFTSQIDHINLQALQLDSLPSSFAANLNINLQGSNLDNLNGEAKIGEIKMSRGRYAFEIERVELNAGFDTSGRRVNLSSDYIDAEITGNYNLSYLDLVYQDILHTLFPDYYNVKAELPNHVDVLAKIAVRENGVLGNLIQQDLYLGNGSFVGTYNSSLESIEVDGAMDQVEFEKYRFDRYYLNIRKKPHQLLNMSTDVSYLYVSDSLLTYNILLNASIQPNDVDFLFNFADTSDNLALRSYGALHFSNDTIGLRVMESLVYAGGKKWQIDDANQIYYTGQKTIIENLRAKNGIQELGLTGKISDEANDRLEISLTHFDLTTFNSFFTKDISIAGLAEGTVSVHRITEKPFVHANLDIFNLAYQLDTIGNVHVETESKDNPLVMNVVAQVKEGLLKDISFSGDIDLQNEDPQFDVKIEANNASIKPFEIFFVGVASNFEGTVSATAELKGTRSKHKLKGRVVAQKVGLDVDYLRSRYYVDDVISLNNEYIEFNSARIADAKGNKGILTGNIKHKLFDDFYLNLKLKDIKKMMCLNTTKDDNSLFYGTAYASGSASFTGYLDNMSIDIQAVSEKGTKITIPIYTESDNAIEDYVRFKVVKDTTVVRATNNRRESIDGMSIKMSFTVTEDAEFELLFDETLDDRITGSGYGNISMEYTSYQDFYMYGDFRISKGVYPFSSPTMVSEKFDLREGGRIVWNGDPYNATIDLQAAVARNRAKPLDLMKGYISAEDEASYNTNIRMNVILHLKGDLFSPDISFSMEFPDNLYTSGLTQFNSLIKRVEADPDELNRQVFSLLTFGSFTPTATYSLADVANPNPLNDIVSSSIGSFLSNQVNNWISEYDKNWELGVDYKTRTGITDEEKAELIVSARRKLFDERLELAGSYNAYSTGSINPYNVDLVYNLKKDGSLKLKAYHKLANDPTLGQVSNVSTTGVGFFFKKQFEKIRFRKSKKVDVE